MDAADLMVQPIALVGGLEDSKAKPEPSDFVRLTNWTTFRGRFALRAPVFLVNTLTASDANATYALAGVYHNSALFLAVYRSINQDVRLWEMTTAGAFVADRGAIWTSIIATIPRPVMCSFEGGSATAGTKRIYIADYDEQQNTRFYDGTLLNTLAIDFDGSGAAENIKYHYVIPYQYHMWGAGFFQGTTGRKEMLRFSQPGLIPAVDPDTTFTYEWFQGDHREIGSRGDKILNVNLTGGPMVISKANQMYALFGYDSQSWAVRQISQRDGAVGPYAAAATGDGYCFFWSERGPHVTDGQEVIDISESVRKHVLEAEVSDKIVVGFSPDDGLVYFLYPRGGSTDPDKWLGYDKERKLWTEGEGLAVGGGLLKVKHVVVVPSTALPGPIAAPSGLTITVVDDTNLDLRWTNGDLALDTTTEVYLDAANPPITLRGVALGSGIAYARVSGLISKTTDFARVRHLRNTQASAYSNVPSARTTLTRPSGVILNRLSNGIRISFTNNEAGADVRIERGQLFFSVSGGNASGGVSWDVVTTLLAQGAGALTYDDTSPTCDQSYLYRLKAQKAAEADSAYTAAVQNTACFPPSISVCTHSTQGGIATGCSAGGTRYTVGWTEVNCRSQDVIKLYRNDNGAGFVLIATLAPGSGIYSNDLWPYKVGSTNRTIQYKVEVWDGGMLLVSSATSTQTNANVDLCA